MLTELNDNPAFGNWGVDEGEERMRRNKDGPEGSRDEDHLRKMLMFA